MTNENLTAEILLNGTGISILDAIRLVLNILDARLNSSRSTPIEFCHRVIETGKRYILTKEMGFCKGLSLYIESKKHLRKESLSDIKYLSSRLLKVCSNFKNRNFLEFSVSDCESWLNRTFSTPSQFNKGRTMLHGLFEFAMRREWCGRNSIKLIERRKVIEKEIKPLSLADTNRIIEISQSPKYKDYLAAVALLIYAGIRPREVYRLKWSDIDLRESAIKVRSQCSKSGGVRQVEICQALKRILKSLNTKADSRICAPNWPHAWKAIRDKAGFKGRWIQDVLRHTYASYHAKYFRDLPRLQLNMGHRNQNLLRSRYINMGGITRQTAKKFFMG